jgi:hypothetical protein
MQNRLEAAIARCLYAVRKVMSSLRTFSRHERLSARYTVASAGESAGVSSVRCS